MTTQFKKLSLLASIVTASIFTQAQSVSPNATAKNDSNVTSKNAFTLSFLPNITLNKNFSANNTNYFAINLLVGYNKGVEFAEFGSVLNIDKGKVHYAQFAGVGNIVSDTVSGGQFAGVYNINAKHSGNFL